MPSTYKTLYAHGMAAQPPEEPPTSIAPWEQNFRTEMVKLRKARDMNQTDLARRLSMWGLPFHQQTIQRIEAGERPIRLNEAHLIARELDADLTTMMSTVSADARLIQYAVNGLQKKCAAFASNLIEDMSEFQDAVTEVAGEIHETLNAGPPQDAVTLYGLAWCVHAYEAYVHLFNGLVKLSDITRGAEGPVDYSFPVFDSIQEWSDLYLHSKDSPRLPDFPREVETVDPSPSEAEKDASAEA